MLWIPITLQENNLPPRKSKHYLLWKRTKMLQLLISANALFLCALFGHPCASVNKHYSVAVPTSPALFALPCSSTLDKIFNFGKY